MGDKRGDIPVLKPGVDIAKPGDPQPEIDTATQKLYEDSLPKTVQIITDKGVGSGFRMDKDGTIGTAAHVVLGSKKHFAIESDGTKFKLEIVKLDDINDTAILRPIGYKEGSRPFVELGSSHDLKQDQAVFPIGYPGGLRPAYISPGNFNGVLTQRQLFARIEPNLEAILKDSFDGLTPQEIPEINAALDRTLLGAKVHIRPGDSGGPMFDSQGKLVGMNDMIINAKDGHLAPKDGFFVPVEKIRELYNDNDSKFAFTYNRVAEPWAQDYKNTWMQKPITAAAETLGAGGIGYLGYRMLNRYPKALGLGAAAYEGMTLLEDTVSLLKSTDSRDKLKFGIATASDITGILGGLAAMSSRYRLGGAIGLAVGIGGRLAADFIPSHLILTDITRKSNPSLPPIDPSLEKSLGL